MHPSPPPLTDQWNLNISIAHKYTGIKNDVQYCMLKKYWVHFLKSILLKLNESVCIKLIFCRNLTFWLVPIKTTDYSFILYFSTSNLFVSFSFHLFPSSLVLFFHFFIDFFFYFTSQDSNPKPTTVIQTYNRLIVHMCSLLSIINFHLMSLIQSNLPFP